MSTAKEIMTRNPLTVKVGSKVKDAARIMLANHYNGLPVVDENNAMVGLICQSDLVSQQKRFKLPSYFVLLDGMIPLGSLSKSEEEIKRMLAVNVEDAMISKPRTVTPDTPLSELATIMVEHKNYTLPVLENGQLVGIVGKEDVLRTLVGDHDD